MRSAYEIVLEISQENYNLGDLDVDGRTALNRIFEEREIVVVV
jgi:hypothetical protein